MAERPTPAPAQPHQHPEKGDGGRVAGEEGEGPRRTEKHLLCFEQPARFWQLVPFKTSFSKLYSSLRRQPASPDVFLSLSSAER